MEDVFKGQGQRSQSLGTKTALFDPLAAWPACGFMFGKTSLASSLETLKAE